MREDPKQPGLCHLSLCATKSCLWSVLGCRKQESRDSKALFLFAA